jgi:hypothetical protein
MTSAPPTPPAQQGRRLVLVTGAGRSGTSTVAGTLHHLGLHVPLPVLKANESNPLGFFESWWPVRFHNKLFERANTGQTDSRPEAFGIVADAVDEQARTRLRTWLSEVVAEADQVVVKDPRALWVPWLWDETAQGLGVTMGYLTMVRHPAEVVGSRSTYYGGSRPDHEAWSFAVSNLAAWVNGNLIVERETRGKRRAVIRYYDLLEDWRSVMRGVAETFELDLQGALESEKHAVDDFIDPSLRRHQPSWEGLDMPAHLVEIAEGVFEQMSRLADARGADAEAEARLDELADRYAEAMRVAQAIARDSTAAQVRAAKRSTDAQVRAELKDEVAKARAEARASVAAATPVPLGRRLEQGLRRRVPEPAKRVVRRVRDRRR